MNDQQIGALAAFAREMSNAYSRLADSLGDSGRMAAPVTDSLYGPATMQLPWNERVLRQSLILHEIQEAGGSVEQPTWISIAGKYGYTGRGVAGFFRAGSAGLLELRKNNRVYITKRGRERLNANKERVAAALTAQGTAAVS